MTQTDAAALVDLLSPRQLDVARLIAVGLRHAAIAKRLKIAPTTLYTYLRGLHRYLDAKTDVQIALVMFAAEASAPRDRNAAKLLATLTPRQADIARLIAGGMRQAEMAASLGIRRRSLAKHLDLIRRKLEARTWVDVARIVLAAR